jgi:hypothetical protein
MSKIKKTIALTSVLLLAFGCGAPAGTQVEAKSDPIKGKPTPEPKGGVRAVPAPAQQAGAKDANPKPAPATKSEAKPSARLVKSWDFRNLDKSKWYWEFPGSGKTASPKGAIFTIEKDGPGPFTMNVGVKAEGVSEVRVYLAAARKGEGGKEIPVSPRLSLYWARESDVQAAKRPEWPFDRKQVVTLEPAGADQPGVYTAKVANEALWNETVECFCIGINLPPAPADQGKSCNITFGGLDLLK